MRTFTNPVLPGFYPDPSVIRVDDDYYLVTSTFEFYPGVPLFHSRDLVNWRQLGHVLDRPSQLNLDGTNPSRGIWAPTIRYHEGVFYMITTFVDNQVACHNFYVTATDPAGPWSDPVWLDNAPGIDPSLLFDNDGKVYYTGNRVPPHGQRHAKDMDIWLQELDLASGKLIGPQTSIWSGALQVAHAQESPHLYRIGDWYYLLIAEGGTGHTHAVTVARSREVAGPYEGYKGNPILTHRHLGRSYPVVNVGHADLVQTQHGDWWMMCLASRPYGGYYRNLGRETFLTKVDWEEEWPLVNPGKGKLDEVGEAPDLLEQLWPADPVRDDFDGEQLALSWNFLRTPRGDFWSLGERPGYLRLRAKQAKLSDIVNPALVCRRQQHMHFRAVTEMAYTPLTAGDAAGLVLFQNQDYQFRMEYAYTESGPELQLTARQGGEDQLLARESVQSERLQLQVAAAGQDYSFSYRTDEAAEWTSLHANADGRLLSTDLAGGFTGAYLGLYAVTADEASGSQADFDWFSYEGLDEKVGEVSQ